MSNTSRASAMMENLGGVSNFSGYGKSWSSTEVSEAAANVIIFGSSRKEDRVPLRILPGNYDTDKAIEHFKRNGYKDFNTAPFDRKTLKRLLSLRPEIKQKMQDAIEEYKSFFGKLPKHADMVLEANEAVDTKRARKDLEKRLRDLTKALDAVMDMDDDTSLLIQAMPGGLKAFNGISKAAGEIEKRTAELRHGLQNGQHWDAKLLEDGDVSERRDNTDKSDYELDQDNIGTSKYKGLAYFWHHEFRHEMRDMKPADRKKVHDAWLKADIGLSNYTQAHADILRDMFGDRLWHEVKKPEIIESAMAEGLADMTKLIKSSGKALHKAIKQRSSEEVETAFRDGSESTDKDVSDFFSNLTEVADSSATLMAWLSNRADAAGRKKTAGVLRDAQVSLQDVTSHFSRVGTNLN